ncbi:unnamed protein product [Taenia asiatica]|uniref:Secreted protein n=1 Tax=Taenia asiatica TaxID=60517 RepID=A0A0R3VUX0_TAEAS|nr:unnamed protein product [Taenia asiatica]
MAPSTGCPSNKTQELSMYLFLFYVTFRQAPLIALANIKSKLIYDDLMGVERSVVRSSDHVSGREAFWSSFVFREVSVAVNSKLDLNRDYNLIYGAG